MTMTVSALGSGLPTAALAGISLNWLLLLVAIVGLPLAAIVIRSMMRSRGGGPAVGTIVAIVCSAGLAAVIAIFFVRADRQDQGAPTSRVTQLVTQQGTAMDREVPRSTATVDGDRDASPSASVRTAVEIHTVEPDSLTTTSTSFLDSENPGWVQVVGLGTLSLIAFVLLVVRLKGNWRAVAVGSALVLLLLIPASGWFLLVDGEGPSSSSAIPRRVELTGSSRSVVESRATGPEAGHSTLVTVRDDIEAWRRLSLMSSDDYTAWRIALESDRGPHSGSSADRAGSGSPFATPGWLDSLEMQRTTRAVDDTSFTLWVPGADGSLVACSEAEPDPLAALQRARETAAEKLAALALERLKQIDRQLVVRVAWPLALRRSLEVVPALETERFEQQANRRYGPIHRAAIRLVVDDESIDGVVERVREDLAKGWVTEQARLRSWLWSALSIGLLGISLFLIYAFLNAGTKGHFAGPLRLISALVFVLLCAAVYFARSRLAP